jgi:hypothetical protein
MLAKSEIELLVKSVMAGRLDAIYGPNPNKFVKELVVQGIEQALATVPTVTPRMLEVTADVILGLANDAAQPDSIRVLSDVLRVLQQLPVADLKPYTVLLVLPDSLADNYGQDTYLVHVEASSVAEAGKMAQEEALSKLYPEWWEETRDPTDFYVSFICEGYVNDMKE